jgi:hypothetical protein
MRRSTFPIWLLIPLGLGAVAVLGALAVLLFVAKPTKATAPDYRVVEVGGLQYEAMMGRPIDPRNAVDAAIVAGLPASERRPRSGEILFGAFIAVANDSPRALPAAERIELRDDAGHDYRPLNLPRSNPYAYVPGPIPPDTRLPRSNSPADDNLAATGLLVLFRIPAADYENGVLELVIHDPRQPGRIAQLVI